jgi:hypothetical protein
MITIYIICCHYVVDKTISQNKKQTQSSPTSIFQNDTQCPPILREKDDSNSKNNRNTNNDN